jgi:hypothetical protein
MALQWQHADRGVAVGPVSQTTWLFVAGGILPFLFYYQWDPPKGFTATMKLGGLEIVGFTMISIHTLMPACGVTQ